MFSAAVKLVDPSTQLCAMAEQIKAVYTLATVKMIFFIEPNAPDHCRRRDLQAQHAD
jgi:hypothetical protein